MHLEASIFEAGRESGRTPGVQHGRRDHRGGEGRGFIPQGRQGLTGFRGGGQMMVMECLSAKAHELDGCVVFCIYILFYNKRSRSGWDSWEGNL